MHDEASATSPALGEPGQKVAGLDAVRGPAPELAVRRPQVRGPSVAESLANRLPERLGNDPQGRNLELDPFTLSPIALALDAPRVPLAGPIPGDLTTIEGPS